MQGEQVSSKSKKDQLEAWRIARDKYKDFQNKYGANPHNRASPPQNPKSDSQVHLEDLNNKLK